MHATPSCSSARRAVGKKPLKPVFLDVPSAQGGEWPVRIARRDDGTLDVKAATVRVLVGEDETLIRLDLRQMLERAGLEVCAEARDGARRSSSRARSEPDIAVLDVKMPRLDGIEAARRMSASGRSRS